MCLLLRKNCSNTNLQDQHIATMSADFLLLFFEVGLLILPLMLSTQLSYTWRIAILVFFGLSKPPGCVGRLLYFFFRWQPLNFGDWAYHDLEVIALVDHRDSMPRLWPEDQWPRPKYHGSDCWRLVSPTSLRKHLPGREPERFATFPSLGSQRGSLSKQMVL